MAENLDSSEKLKTAIEESQDSSRESMFDVPNPNTLKTLDLPKIPNVKPPKFKISKPNGSFKKVNFLWFGLFIILVSYICMGYFLSILLTIPARKNLAIAGFMIVGLLPAISGFADYALMKWGYLVSGLLIVGSFIFLVKIKCYLLCVAIASCFGIMMLAFIGDSLLNKKHKLINVIMILTLPCVVGLGLGWQLWHLAATLWS